MNGLDRRSFLKKAGLVTGGAMVSPKAFGKVPMAEPGMDPVSDVVVVTDDTCTTGSSVNAAVVRSMVDAGICTYTGIPDAGEAWMSIFPGISSDSVIGIKVCCAAPNVPSNPETAQAVGDGLALMPVAGGFDPNNIIIFERTNYELTAAGYTINTGRDGVRCFGTNQGGIGYSTTAINVNGVTSYPSRIITDHIDYMINLAVMKDHGIAGVTLCLKNHYGSSSNVIYMHGNYCNPYIPALSQQFRDTLGGKEKFRMIDAIFGIRSGGPSGWPQFVYDGIIMGEDIVAVDRAGLDILEENGMNHGWQATHIETASQPPYELGNYESSMINRIDISNPTSVEGNEVQIPDDFRLEQNFPNPFNQSTGIRFTIHKKSNVSIRITNGQGRQVAVLADGGYNAGAHLLQWDGRNADGGILPSGVYFCRMMTGNFSRTVEMVLLK
ncbi:MAG: DUF362 domain-containing protein [FCB group bacterium]|nr:DUF362 domain-containing protein [FCB group bacterium]